MLNADLVLHNGNLITLERAFPHATALAIQGERIAWVGNEREAKEWIGPRTHTVDLKNSYVYPGFIDSHAHIIPMGALKLHYLDLTSCPNKESVLEKVKEKAKKVQPGTWILGAGWDEDRWPEQKLPTASDLDVAAPHHPVFLRRIDSHAVWVNRLALRLAGIDAATPDHEGGKIYRDAEGNPTGILLDAAIRPVYQILPRPTLEETLDLTQAVLKECLQKGVTMIHNAATFEDDLHAFETLAKRHVLPLRIYAMAVIPNPVGEAALKRGPQCYTSFFELRCLKLFIDGAMGSRGAALLEPYQDDPQNNGLILWNEEDLCTTLQQAKEKGLQVAIHAIGDRGIRVVLNAYEKVKAQGLRWRIEHAQLVHADDIKRFKTLGVIAAMQPLHATEDMRWIEERVGYERAKRRAFVWRSLLDCGTMIAGGSDAPVVDINPLWGMHAAITRQDFKGMPEGGWFAEQRVTPLEALRMYTIDAAYAAFRENELGSIKPGKLADLVVLPENLLSCDPQALIDMKVLYTIVNGKINYSYNTIIAS